MLETKYKKGLHVLAEVKSNEMTLLKSHQKVKELFDALIEKHGLHKLGEFYYDFPGGGYTGVVCLTESHISIHTWPEYAYFTFDVFLSNYQKENDDKAKAIFNETVSFFKSIDYTYNELKR
jgi:S-adenosylmethionine decarboxylase